MSITENIGKTAPSLWFGVVEDRIDPLKAGRVRVRIIGVHSASLQAHDESGKGIPVDSLQWATVIQSSNNAAMQGIGSSPNMFVEGTHVMGFARDTAMQSLVVLGSIQGIHKSLPDFAGFFDTQDTANRPKRPTDTEAHYPRSEYLNEPDVNRLARNEQIDKTIVQTKKDSVVTNVDSNGVTWSEPQTPYAAQYPYNRVEESESGHIIERDDTPGKERTHDYHRSGTFKEVHPDGTQVEKIVKDNYEIILGDDYISVSGKCNVFIGGDANMHVGGNMNIKADGTCTIESAGNMKFIAPRIDLN